MRRFNCVSILLALFIWGCDDGSPGSSEPPAKVETPTNGDAIRASMVSIRDSYRETIVLMSDEPSLERGNRDLAVVVGRYLFETNLEKIGELTVKLLSDLDAGAEDRYRKLPAILSFLDELENGEEWHDADKLVLRDVTLEIADYLSGLQPTSPAGKALLMRIEEDVRALDKIQTLYNDELKEIFSRIDTRGMEVTREKWEDYISFLKEKLSAKKIFEKHRSALGEIERLGGEPTTRGEVVEEAKDFPLNSWLIDGTELPDKTLILTFDDGPHGKHTGKILDILDSFNVKAVFFEVGRSVGRSGKSGKTKLLKRSKTTVKVATAGHMLANHTQTHPVLTRLSNEEILDELATSKKTLAKAIGEEVKLFRPPYGASGKRIRKISKSLGLRTVMWNVDSRDWADPIPRSIASRVISQTDKFGRGVLLFHDIHARTVEALPLVLETLLEKGYRFVLWDGKKIPASEPPRDTGDDTPAISKLYTKSHAVVIGINEYESWPRLHYAVNDAKSMADLLSKEFGFAKENVHLILDKEATRENIMSLLGGDLSDPRNVGEQDRVMIFFAGHGTTRTLPSGRSLGYIIPVDADRTTYQSRAISMTEFQDINEAIPAKHVFYMMDACYGGQVLLRGGGGGHAPHKYIKEVTTRRVRQVLTAGGAKEQVSDNGPNGHSIFTWTVLEGLRGKADLNGDLHITATELFAHVAPVVSSLSKQTPAFGSLVGSEGGEFVFELPVEEEFLIDRSSQLDEEAIALNSQIEEARRLIQDKLSRNDSLKSELAAVTAELDALKARGQVTEEIPVKKGPRRALKLRQLGMSLFREKRYQEAVDAYKESIEIQPKNPLAINNLGYTYFAMGRLNDAMEWYEKTLEIDPERAIVFVNIAELHLQRKETAKAIDAYNKFLELEPDHKLASRVRKNLEHLGSTD